MFTEGCWGDKSSIREMLKSHGYLYSTRPVEVPLHLHSAGVFLGKHFESEVSYLNIFICFEIH